MKIELWATFLLLLNSCSTDKVQTVVQKPAPSLQEQLSSIKEYRDSQYTPNGDVYEIKYRKCNEICESNRQAWSFLSWGKPSNMGILYTNSGGEPSTVFPKGNIHDNSVGVYITFNSKGNFENTMKPSKDEGFTIFSSIGRNPTARVEIISIKKLTIPQEVVARKKYYLSPFQEKQEAKKVERYIGVKPQQVDKITWQEGQPPQIIGIRIW